MLSTKGGNSITAVSKTYDSAMNSFIGSLHGTSRSGSSSSNGGCHAIYQTSYAQCKRSRSGVKAYLARCDMHDKIHRGEIARERKTILHELKDGEPR